MRSGRRAAFVALAVAALAAGCAPEAAGPPVLDAAPHFTLTDASNARRSSRELAGRAWVAAFIYTRCPGPCPLIAGRMRALQSELPPDSPVTLVSFTVDPENDTPEALARFARDLGADPRRWWFLTGEGEEVRRLVVNGFRLAVASAPAGAPRREHGPILHATRVVLVDGEGRIRGYYEGEDDRAWRALRRDVSAVLRARRR